MEAEANQCEEQGLVAHLRAGGFKGLRKCREGKEGLVLAFLFVLECVCACLYIYQDVSG